MPSEHSVEKLSSNQFSVVRDGHTPRRSRIESHDHDISTIAQLSPVARDRLIQTQGEMLSRIARVTIVVHTIFRFSGAEQFCRVLERVRYSLSAHPPRDKYLSGLI